MEPTPPAPSPGIRAREYDALIRRCVPRYEEMLGRMAAYLPEQPRRILELGCGTGGLTLRLARRFPDADLTYLDEELGMILVTEKRLSLVARSGSSKGGTQSIEEISEEAGSSDLVTSTIGLRHVRQKGTFYARLFEVLDHGGVFLAADQLRGAGDEIHRKNWEAWLQFCRGSGAKPEEIKGWLEHAEEHDHYTPLAEHFELLGDAGFVDVDCVWRDWTWGILTARKPGGR